MLFICKIKNPMLMSPNSTACMTRQGRRIQLFLLPQLQHKQQQRNFFHHPSKHSLLSQHKSNNVHLHSIDSLQQHKRYHPYHLNSGHHTSWCTCSSSSSLQTTKRTLCFPLNKKSGANVDHYYYQDIRKQSYSTTLLLSIPNNPSPEDKHNLHDSTTKKNNEKNNDTTTTTKPLSELSSSDLKLAMETIIENNNNNNNNTHLQHQHQTTTTKNSININSIPGTSQGKKLLAILYTCNICNTRSAKKFTEQAYNHGVVLVRCPKCENLHLIADRLGYFTDDDYDNNDSDNSGSSKKGWDIEMFMNKINQKDNIKIITHSSNSGTSNEYGGETDSNEDDVLEITIEDIVGETYMKEVEKKED